MKKRINVLLWGGIAVYLLGMLLMSVYTSPMWPKAMGIDSALFRLLGRGILDGKTIYVDLFDHKGPILFYIEAIGEFFGKFGVWGLQCIFGIATICVLYKTGKEIQTNNSSAQFVISFLASLLVFFYTFESGNISEEFSLLFIASSFLLFGKYGSMCKDSAKDHPVSFAFLHGMCIAILAFIRLNNALSNCAGLLAIALFLVKEKKWKNLFQNICYQAKTIWRALKWKKFPLLSLVITKKSQYRSFTMKLLK